MFGTRSFYSVRVARAAMRSSLNPRPPKLQSTRFNSTSSKPPNFFRLTHLWYGIVLAAGVSVGLAVRNFAAPLPLPTPGSREDELALGALAKDVDKLDIVTFMRSQCQYPPSDIMPSEPEEAKRVWIELDMKRNLTDVVDDTDKTRRIVTEQTLAGAQGLGVQRAFWNSETGELIAVVWIGGALSGWPSLAHGGAIATIFEDAMSRMVAGSDGIINSIPGPSSMSVTYAQPTHVLNFYILRANFSKPRVSPACPPSEMESAKAKSWLPFWKDVTKKAPHTEIQPNVEIIGTLESVKGQLCVRAKGTFPVSVA